MNRTLLASIVGLMAFHSLCRAGDFALKDGDTVVFLGDSITAARTYGKIIENYTLLRFPDRKVTFINAGWGGDTAAGGLKRFERDVLSHRPTVVTIAYGVNDIGWGTKADDEHKKAYLDGIRGMVEACKKHNVRVYICSAAATGEDPAKAETGYLQTMCDEGMKLSKSLGGNAIDVQREMRSIQRKIFAANEKVKDKSKHDSLHTADGVHLNDLGQLAMAYAILKGLHAPADVSSATIDVKAKTSDVKNCTVSDISPKNDGVEFTRLDKGLPFNYGIFFALNYRYVPVPEDLNQYLLKVKGLVAGTYDLTADGRALGYFTADQLAEGVNIASATADAWYPGGTWDVQAGLLKSLTDSRHEAGDAALQASRIMPGHPLTAELAKQNADFDTRIVAMQRTIVQPQPYRFAITPAKKADKK